ncbi:MAG: type II toxin-antitoxin system CcdA family antitoxin [Acidobacteria bacterium]|nr:type II toxin-antitoxin system CcdA family antitoxin [Acidobacteriota bacterium]
MKRQTRSEVKRRTTLTLPSDALAQAGRIARGRKVNLSVVVAEALSEGLRAHAATERSRQVLESYRQAFTGFSADELAILDGVMLAGEPE